MKRNSRSPEHLNVPDNLSIRGNRVNTLHGLPESRDGSSVG
jgi:hypothetical protein